MSKVSVIIPCYNHGHYLDEAVHSILNQTYQDFEIIIVNDGSTDPFTQEKLHNYQKPKTTVLHTPNQGPSAARNTGIKAAQGEYMLTLDADDYFEPTFLEKAVPILDQQPTVGIVGCGVQNFGADRKCDIPRGGDVKNFLAKTAVHADALFRKQCWEQAGGYNEQMKNDSMGYEDWDFWIAVTKHGWTAHIIPEYLLKYRRHRISRRTKANDNRPNVVRQVTQHHREVYQQYVDEVIFEKEQKILKLWRQQETLLNSWSYRLGSGLLSPFRFFKTLLHR